MKKLDVAIIGAGTSGLTARRQVAAKTDRYLVFDDGPLGTTCARVGCMPSKVLIQVANDFDRRKSFVKMGIHGQDKLQLSSAETMHFVRSLRDRFVRGVLSGGESWMQSHLVRERAHLISQNQLQAGQETFEFDRLIIGTGSRPIIPKPWQAFRSHLITTDQFFELETLPKSMAIIGLGVIGIELGQALHRLGVDVVGVTMGPQIAGVTDPKLQGYVLDKFRQEFAISTDGAVLKSINNKGHLIIESGDKSFEVEKALVAVGRMPNLDGLGLENLEFEKDSDKRPKVDPNTLQLLGSPNIFIAGDVNGERTLLHEAADEGFIAGFNAVNKPECFRRRTFLGITFCDPNIAMVGKSYEQLQSEPIDYEVGEVSFEGQGRSIVKLKEQGLLRVYAEKKSGLLLGAELQAPDGEHLAHLLAWAISLKLTAQEALTLPFYHPVVEEGLRTALRDVVKKIDPTLNQSEILRCADSPIR